MLTRTYGDVFVWGRVSRSGTDSGRTFPGFCEPTSLSHAHLQERGDQSESESELVSQIIGGEWASKSAAGGRARIAVTPALLLPLSRLPFRARVSLAVVRLPLPLSSSSDLCLVASSLSLSSSVFLISLEKLFAAVKPPPHFVQRCSLSEFSFF